MNTVAIPMIIGNLGPTEMLLILLVLVLLFGAKKLPELARGSGRALRIFKSETKGLMDDDNDDPYKTEEQRQVDAQTTRPDAQTTRSEAQPVETPAEQRRPETDR